MIIDHDESPPAIRQCVVALPEMMHRSVLRSDGNLCRRVWMVVGGGVMSFRKLSNRRDCFPDLSSLVDYLRSELESKNAILLYAYNGTGKTRLSMAFKDAGRQAGSKDTLYFNAFTEDLFHWNNDLESDTDRRLMINRGSRFFRGLDELEMDNRIRPLLQRYADFDFCIDTDEWVVRFSRRMAVRSGVDGEAVEEFVDNIKISRGEESIFIWCFF